MPNYRRAVVFAPEDPGTSGTKIFPIYLKELVSSFHIRFGVTINTASVMLAPLADSISKIELVDGSTVLFSLTGPEAVASNFYRTGKLPIEHKNLTKAEKSYFEVSIMFGRYLWDETLAWDPNKFVAPQIRITWDSTTANAGVTVTSLSLVADIIDNPSSAPTGIILSKDQDQYALAGSSHEYIDLPVDYSVGMVGIRFKSSTYSPSGLMDNFKFSRDQDAFIWLDQSAQDYIDMLQTLYGEISVPTVLDDAVTADTLYVIPTDNQSAVINFQGSKASSTAATLSTPTFSGNKLAITASVVYDKRSVLVRGSIPHGVVPFYFGMKDNPATWYKPSANTKFRADLLSSTNAASTDTAYLFTEQLRPY